MAQITASPHAPPSVLCPALAVLTLISLESKAPGTKLSSFPSLELTIKTTNGFVDALVSRLSSSNIQIIVNSLQLINTLILTFSISLDSDVASPIFDDLRDAGLLRSIAQLYENKPLAASCSPQLYDLQELIRAAFHKYSTVDVDPSLDIHQQSIRRIEQIIAQLMGNTGNVDWERAGIPEHSDLATEVNSSLKWGGLQDLSDFLSQEDMIFKKMYLEHLAFAPANSSFPIAHASLAVSEILYSIFGVSSHKIDAQYVNSVPDSFLPAPYHLQPDSSASAAAIDRSPFSMLKDDSITKSQKITSSLLYPIDGTLDPKGHQQANSVSTTSTGVSDLHGNATSSTADGKQLSSTALALSNASVTGSSSVELELAKLSKLRPLIFEWSTLVSSGVVNFLRLWLASNAQRQDFDNIRKVVEVLFRNAIPDVDFSTVSIDNVVNKLDTLSYADIRAIQLKNIEEDLNHQWGYEIRSLHNQFHQESYDFVKEQRIRLLLRGEWFYIDNPVKPPTPVSSSKPNNALATRSSLASTSTGASGANTVAAPTPRRYFVALSPSLNTLHYSEYPEQLPEYPSVDALSRTIDLLSISKVVVTSLAPTATRKSHLRVNLFSRANYSRISLIFSGAREGTTLTFYTDSPEKAAAWGDGLLMLKGKPYQSKETKKYIDMFAETKLRLQLLQVTPNDLTYATSHTINHDDYESVMPTDNYHFS